MQYGILDETETGKKVLGKTKKSELSIVNYFS